MIGKNMDFHDICLACMKEETRKLRIKPMLTGTILGRFVSITMRKNPRPKRYRSAIGLVNTEEAIASSGEVSAVLTVSAVLFH